MKNIQSIIKTQKIYLIAALLLLFSTGISAQKQTASNSSLIKATPAYAELLLRRAELESEVESLLESYTEEFPKVKAAKYELALVNKDLARLLTQTDVSKLTLSLGKLLVRKNELETEYWMLQNQYDKEHPEVKRAQRKVLSFQKAIKEILP